MGKTDLPKLLKTQVSLTEWFKEINHQATQAFQEEDISRYQRLAILNKVIRLPYDKPWQFKATDVFTPSAKFRKFLKEHGSAFCGIRANPLQKGLAKLRMRGHTITDAVEWLRHQEITRENYSIDIIPHSNNTIWSTIFVINKHGGFGEIIRRDHYQLTQAFDEGTKPMLFQFDFKKVYLSAVNPEAKEHIANLLAHLVVKDKRKRSLLARTLWATFTNDYLNGYFETIQTQEYGIWFIDYNRVLGKLHQNFDLRVIQKPGSTALKGFVASKGKVTGKVRKILDGELETATLSNDEILVVSMTTPQHVHLMQQACAIVTDMGGILSHAAIISRELGKPCITGTQNATQVLAEGDFIEVDAYNGTINLLQKTG